MMASPARFRFHLQHSSSRPCTPPCRQDQQSTAMQLTLLVSNDVCALRSPDRRKIAFRICIFETCRFRRQLHRRDLHSADPPSQISFRVLQGYDSVTQTAWIVICYDPLAHRARCHSDIGCRSRQSMTPRMIRNVTCISALVRVFQSSCWWC